jgi:hypothetical protein
MDIGGLSMKNLQPSLKDWKALYEVAVEFRKAEPWAWIRETDIFGVQNPKTGEIGYCCIMGELGEVMAIAIYEGTEGLQSYLKIRKGQIKPGDPDALFMQKCLMLSFENGKFVEEDDKEIIDELGLKFRGRNAWPVFRSYQPGYFPWFLNRDEVLYMTLALRQAMEICLRIKKDGKILHAPKRNYYLVRAAEEKAGKFFWKDEWKAPAPVSKKAEALNEPVNEVRVQKLKKTAKPATAVWEIDFFHTPTPVMQGERPVFPYAIMLMDNDTGLILEMHLAETAAYQREFLDKFLGCIEKTSVIPLEILVKKEEAAGLLGPYAGRLNIKLSMVRKLNNIGHARREIDKFMQ